MFLVVFFENRGFNADELQFIHFFFSYDEGSLGPKIYSPTPRLARFSPVFSSRSFFTFIVVFGPWLHLK